jgi:RNA polymerase sigma factor (sigma-70 family)
MTCMNAMNDVPTHIPFLHMCAGRLCRNEADARDLVQDTCLQAIVALRETESPPHNLRGWLVAVMRNQWFSTLRRHRVRANAHAELAANDRFDTALHETRLLSSQLTRAWSQLSAQSQNIARQCLIEGESQQGVSRKLGMTSGGVAASIHRTRHALRQSILGGSN